METNKILLIENNLQRVERLQFMLKNEYEIVHYQELEPALMWLAKNDNTQLVLLNYMLSPDLPGDQVIAKILDTGSPEIIALFEEQNHEMIVAAMKANAYFCLCEPLYPFELKNKISNAILKNNYLVRLKKRFQREFLKNYDVNVAVTTLVRWAAKRKLEGRELLEKEQAYLFPLSKMNSENLAVIKENVEKQKKAPAQHPIEKPCVLIIDDHEKLRRQIKFMVSDYFFAIEAGNGEEAIKQCTDYETIDLILLDIRMPGIQGHKLMPTLKEMHPEAEIIIITAYRETDVAVEVFKNGAFTYLNKPFDEMDLINTLNEALKIRYLKQCTKELTGEESKSDIFATNIMPRIEKFTELYQDRIANGLHVSIKEFNVLFPELVAVGFSEGGYLPDNILSVSSIEEEAVYAMLFWLTANMTVNTLALPFVSR